MIELNNNTIWDKHGQYPDVEQLKEHVHKLLSTDATDATDATIASSVTDKNDENGENDKEYGIDDDDAIDTDEDDMEELRRYYGVM